MLPFEALRDQLIVDHGAVRAGPPTLFSIMRNERFFLEAVHLRLQVVVALLPLRAGLRALNAMEPAALQALLGTVPKLKAGRPAKGKEGADAE